MNRSLHGKIITSSSGRIQLSTSRAESIHRGKELSGPIASQKECSGYQVATPYLNDPIIVTVRTFGMDWTTVATH